MQRAIDHLVLAVRDLAAAGAFYERLGFTLTPRARHPFGTENRLAQLQGSLLELLAVADPKLIPEPSAGEFSFGAFNAEFLRRRQGMSMLVFRHDDARRDQREFVTKGLDAYAPFDFARKAKLPDGTEAEVAFSLAFVTNRDMPDAVFFVSQQHAPQYFWKAEYQRHANRATGVAEVLMAAPQPARFADFFERLAGPGAAAMDGTALRVKLEGAAILILDEEALRARHPAADAPNQREGARFAGFTVKVDDLAELERLLRQERCSLRADGRALPGGARGRPRRDHRICRCNS